MLKIILLAIFGALAGAIGIGRFLLRRASRVREVFIAIGLAVLSVLIETSIEVLFGLEDPEILFGPTFLLWGGIAAFIGAVIGVAVAFGAGRGWIVAVLAILGISLGDSIGGMSVAMLLGLCWGCALFVLPKKMLDRAPFEVFYGLAILAAVLGLVGLLEPAQNLIEWPTSFSREMIEGSAILVGLITIFTISAIIGGKSSKTAVIWFARVFMILSFIVTIYLAVLSVIHDIKWVISVLIVLAILGAVGGGLSFSYISDRKNYGVAAVGMILGLMIGFKLGSLLQDLAVPDPIIGGMLGALLGSVVMIALWLRKPHDLPTLAKKR